MMRGRRRCCAGNETVATFQASLRRSSPARSIPARTPGRTFKLNHRFNISTVTSSKAFDSPRLGLFGSEGWGCKALILFLLFALEERLKLLCASFHMFLFAIGCIASKAFGPSWGVNVQAGRVGSRSPGRIALGSIVVIELLIGSILERHAVAVAFSKANNLMRRMRRAFVASCSSAATAGSPEMCRLISVLGPVQIEESCNGTKA